MYINEFQDKKKKKNKTHVYEWKRLANGDDEQNYYFVTEFILMIFLFKIIIIIMRKFELVI